MKANDVQREVEKLLNYEFTDEEGTEKPIVVVGPDRTTTTMPRVYAYGGRIGRLATQGNHNNQLADEKYAEWIKKANEDYLQSMIQKYPDLAEEPGTNLGEKLSCRLKKMLELEAGKEKDELLRNPQYLDLILKAAKIRFTNPREDEYERKIQTEIVKKHLNKKPGDGWCIVDMEFAISEKDEDTQDRQIFKPDIVVLDKEKGFGLVELKYQNKNTENLSDHYTKISGAANGSNAGKLVEEIERRYEFLLNYELVHKELYEICQKPKSLWYGFLFVGGEKEKSVALIKEISTKHPEIKKDENCRFWHFPKTDLENMNLSFAAADTYEAFTK